MTRDTHPRFDFGTLAQDYDRWYETADGKAHDRQQKAAVVRILPFPARNAKLLDIGCGTGHWSHFFASLGFSVTGVDLSPQMIEQACSRDSTHCVFGIADACCLPFGDAAFDVVAAMTVIEFASCAEAIVAEMFRCVSKDGAVIVGALNALAPLNRNRVAEGKEPYASARLFAPHELRDLLEPYGMVRMLVTAHDVGNSESQQMDAFVVAKASRHMR